MPATYVVSLTRLDTGAVSYLAAHRLDPADTPAFGKKWTVRGEAEAWAADHAASYPAHRLAVERYEEPALVLDLRRRKPQYTEGPGEAPGDWLMADEAANGHPPAPSRRPVRIAIEYDDGFAESAEGPAAAAILGAYNDALAFRQIHGLPYDGPKMRPMSPPAPNGHAPTPAEACRYRRALESVESVLKRQGVETSVKLMEVHQVTRDALGR
jgi:hypothetical protein